MSHFYFVRIPKILRLFSGIKWYECTKGKSIYLTFDDGPNRSSTTLLLKLLADCNVLATFFLIGQNTEQNPDLIQSIIKQGHKVGNHGYLHLNGYEAENRAYVDNVIKGEDAIGDNSLNKLFRPPYGKIKRSQVKLLNQEGYSIVNWSMMPGDFDSKVTNQMVTKRLMKYRSGDVIVLHDTFSSFEKYKEGLVSMINKAKSEGFEFKLL